MITDTMMKEATAELDQWMLSRLPDLEACKHTFSQRFENKMEQLIRRMRHPVRYKVLRYAAIIVLAISLLFGSAIAVSPEVRAAVVGWIRETFGQYSKYSYESSSPTESNYDYQIKPIPEGYSLMTAIDRENGKTYIYTNQVGQMLQFSYIRGTGDDFLYIDTEQYDIHTTFVGSIKVDVYIAKDSAMSNEIVWTDPNTNVTFLISAFLEEYKLFELMQCVESEKIISE